MKNQATFLLSLLFIPFTSSIIAQNPQSYRINNTMPELEIVNKLRVDTVSIYDYETGKEEIQIVSNTILHVIGRDTTSIFNYETYEETFTVINDTIPLYEFYEKTDEKWFGNIDKHTEYIKKEADLPIDTIYVFDSNTYEEKMNIVRRRHPCYSFGWGLHCFSDKHIINREELEKLLRSNINISLTHNDLDCEAIETFECRIVIINPEDLPYVAVLNRDTSQLDVEKYMDSLITDKTRIYIEDIEVNGKRVIDAIAIKVYDDE